jgi:hypothetical protein
MLPSYQLSKSNKKGDLVVIYICAIENIDQKKNIDHTNGHGSGG